MDFITVSLVLVAAGIIVIRFAGAIERKHRRSKGEEHKLTGRVDEKREQYEHAMTDLKNLFPEVSQLPTTDDRWLGRVMERLNDRSLQKDREEKIRLVAQARRFYAEYWGALEEQRLALEALDDLGRAKRGNSSTEKNEEAEIRGLERKKRKIALEREIENLERKPEPAASVPRPRRIPKMERIAQMRKQQSGDHEKYADDPGMQSLSDADWDDKISRVMEESD